MDSDQRQIVRVIKPELLRLRDAAVITGMSETMFKQLNRRGAIGPKPIRLSDKCVRWIRAELVDWARSGCPSRERWMEQKQATQQTTTGPRLADSA